MLCERYLINFKCKKSTSYANMCTCVLRMYTSECLHVNIYTNKSVREVRNISSCGTVALMVLGQFSDICDMVETVALMVLCQFSDIYGYGDPQISENWPRIIRATVPQLKHLMNTLRCHQVDKTTQQDVMKKSISCKASEQVGF